jgi:hypothetical protein
MPRIPKDPKLRQRRNRVSTAAKLLDDSPISAAPELPKRRPDQKKWHAWTLAWWKLVWESPMAAEYLESDVPGLVTLAMLKDNFVREPKPGLAAEIRMQEQRFGLSPIDRRRLQWEVERVQKAAGKGKGDNLPPSHPKDPRGLLHVVQ